MQTRPQRHAKGRAANATALIATLLDQLPPDSPALETAQQLAELFPDRRAEMRALLDRIPGSLEKKGDKIGIGRGTVWAIWAGRYIPSPEVMARIEAAAEEET